MVCNMRVLCLVYFAHFSKEDMEPDVEVDEGGMDDADGDQMDAEAEEIDDSTQGYVLLNDN